MKHVWLDYSDGQYSTRPLNEVEAVTAKANGCTVVEVADRVYEAWLAHLAQHAVFDALWCALDNAATKEERIR